jgi:DegV family protein with EDD domain
MSGKVALVTDSTSDIPPARLAELGIALVPLSVFFGDEEHEDAVGLTPAEFYRLLRERPELPTTSQPSPGKFLACYQRLQAEGVTEILSIHISGALSGTVQSAAVAAKMVTGAKVRVLDSRSVSWGLGMQVLRARELLAQGLGAEETAARITDLIPRVSIYFTVDSLEALRRGGRIGQAAAFFGQALGIRPILACPGTSGKVEAIRKVRSHAAALKALVDLARADHAAHGVEFGLAVVSSNAPERQAELRTALLATGLDFKHVLGGNIGAVIGTHLGPDGWGFMLC